MRRPIFLLLFLLSLPASRAAEPFEIKDGDRVVLLGDTLLERENTYGYLETRMHEQFPDRRFTVRNLSWAGDTPRGWSRASFDPPAKGWERLKESIAEAKPTVVFLGYGMAASLQEMTDRAQDITLNRDATRYGAEPMSAARFKRELGELMDAIGKDVRFVLLSPIRHEDLRAVKPGMPDPAPHNALLVEYSKAIEALAKERGAEYLPLNTLPPKQLRVTTNGIHLSEEGYAIAARVFARELGIEDRLNPAGGAAAPIQNSEALRAAVLKKNDLFFHRFRPENATYLFGFRKHEQGQNAKEIAMFDPLIAAADAEIDRLKRGGKSDVGARKSDEAPASPVAAGALLPPLPDFTVQDGYQIELWAQNPLLEKPTQMNWDAQGRLWVCSSSLYPQIAPGQAADDKILILEDTDRDGKADKSTVFTGGLLIPTAVVPDLVEKQKAESGKQKSAAQPPSDVSGFNSRLSSFSPAACYVGQSTELLHFTDTDGDGKADTRRVVFSGFGTEDTHHLIHTLKWGPDGRLYFNQSIYIHSHLETPWGMVRLNSGGIFAYDPRTERVEVLAKGWCNPWGHAWDQWGQSFTTDGAGGQGISWVIPGAMYFTYENGRKIAPSISPGSYPKFASLELIHSPHFPADWQGNAITNDFRAHRIVRFSIEDLSAGPEPKSGYVTKEQPDLVRTSDQSFRPIDVRLGPDGALYIADWSNPVINHGEVDFRDPRRDKHMGRIWRISKKDAPPVKWEPLVGKRNEDLDQLSKSAWEKEQSMQLLAKRGAWLSNPTSVVQGLSAETLGNLVSAPNPRTRLLVMRALSGIPTAESAALVLTAALKAPKDDAHYDYAAWLSINDLAQPWTDAIASGAWKADTAERQQQLAWGLKNIDPALAGATLSRLFAENKVPLDGSGPWIELLGQAGGPKELRALFDRLSKFDGNHAPRLSTVDETRVMNALADAARLRNVRPEGDLTHANVGGVTPSNSAHLAAFLRMLGFWKTPNPDHQDLIFRIASASNTAPEVRTAAIESLRNIGKKDALSALTAADRPIDIRRTAVAALAQLDLNAAVAAAADIFPAIADENAALETWRGLLGVKGAADKLAAGLPKEMPKPVAMAGLRAAREAGKPGAKLLAALTPLAGVSDAEARMPKDFKALAGFTKQNGDPARGEMIYRRAALACTVCHAIGGAGGKVGPDMTSLGASAPLDYIIESVIAPALKVKEGYNAVAFTLKDGTQATGVQARETAQEIILRDVVGHEKAVAKAQLASTTNVGSIMPAGLVDQLQDRERLDLFAFLGELGKPGPYDASKGSVARVWRLFSGADAAKVISGETPLDTALPGYTLVDGRFTRELLAASAPLVANGADTLMAVAQFQSTGKTRLKLTGAGKAWLDGKPLELSGDLAPELPAGIHTLAVKLDVKTLPDHLRAESPDARFIGN